MHSMKPIHFFLTIISLTIFSSCDSNESLGEAEYSNKSDKVICDCYRERHDRNDIDYDEELKKDFKYWNSKIPEFDNMDKATIIQLIDDFKNDKIIISLTEDYVEYESKLNYRYFHECVEKDSYVNPESKKIYEVLDYVPEHMMDMQDSTQTLWEMKLDESRKIISSLDDAQLLNPFYIGAVKYLYKEYLKMSAFEKEAKIEAQKELERQRIIEEQNEYIRLNPPPPPPRAVPPPTIEVEVWENEEEEPPINY